MAHASLPTTLDHVRVAMAADDTFIPFMQQQNEKAALDNGKNDVTSRLHSLHSDPPLPAWFHYTEANRPTHHLNEHADEAFHPKTVAFIAALHKKNRLLGRITTSDVGQWIDATARAFYDKDDAQQRLDASMASMKALKKDADKQDRMLWAKEVGIAKQTSKVATQQFNTLSRATPRLTGADSDTLRFVDIQLLTSFAKDWMPSFLESVAPPFYQITTVAKAGDDDTSFFAKNAVVPFDEVVLEKRRTATGVIDALCRKQYATSTQYLTLTFWGAIDRTRAPPPSPPVRLQLQPAYYYFQQQAMAQFPELATPIAASTATNTDTLQFQIAGIGTIFARDANYGAAIFEGDKSPPKDVPPGCVPSMPTKRLVHAMLLLEKTIMSGDTSKIEAARATLNALLTKAQTEGMSALCELE